LLEQLEHRGIEVLDHCVDGIAEGGHPRPSQLVIPEVAGHDNDPSTDSSGFFQVLCALNVHQPTNVVR
jgi:hypothetical protein